VLRKILLFIGLFLVLAAGGFTTWASITSPILPSAQEALVSDSQVQVTAGDWLVFQPAGPQPETGLVFYPGGRVDYRAYAPYARAVASQGTLVVIVQMPLNLAVINPNAAQEVISAYPDVQRWAVGGHSLGGAMAASYAAANTSQVDGLVLLAAYPASSADLSGTDLPVVSIYATQDGLATRDKIDAARSLLPADTRYVVVQGGNHAQFGDYGEQSGDLPAEISRADQQAQAAAATLDLIQRMQGTAR
jgi:pimeloyl-ACP methyl ester carboxylesterase